MISDEQRREVARNLRVLDGGMVALIEEQVGKLTGTELAGCLVFSIGLCVALYAADFDTKTLGDFWDLLADLIDRPTCRIGYVPGSADRSCSACGVTFSTGTYQGGDHEEHEFMFCPNCGAEVVENEESNGD